ncbi:lipid IV(A) 3-deoxy-D-manno-octulosonic acid transferase [Ectothiorhodospira variabilis]|uniref:lipid IV(A) 3-deoxy-D-manno-octulosonic acid transferase n=1 Tax=Ectothiorhodospira variabilis TaxID=505694 RepID=UPI001EFA318B|nr:lipid IV(A) 3-deoxy-D-manno-octulosonic acid transferase [Ectothiorhodospira variabilis]MCG5493450.1 lipid IV(A) 3-deoxy-D-manno-octulosonic acid transferase [Ectothiorhodospira variabilis]MCG5496796.1 lipid IV(A) 3-deoxy-D-manno-octulosonic acid transferase [Ectothiorhodospira variabilis]MCG5502779.1 lipid IV(A) 3-deoxy-D-manno-octulosonic acid transferase [Ectothiorhodospira variabilis]MCG5505455.1 lipid IV(A) 3-deoxy-D-manno-octulosonic acid transferase [Ectothiorhodospira variabilis]
MTQALYNLLIHLLTPVFLLRLLWRSRRNPAYRQRWGERLGFPEPPRDRRPHLWVHAVSVGEVVAATALIRAWRERHPEQPVLVTTTTPTGADEVVRRLGDAVIHRYLPFDLPGAVGRFLKRMPVDRLLVMETELWPNLYRACHAHRTPILLVNARLSPRSFRGYQRLRPLVQRTLGWLEGVAARGPEDADRFVALGALPDRVRVAGNIKYDLTLSDALLNQARALRDTLGTRPVWIAASTHPGEDEQVLKAHAIVRQALPDALLILVPRHPERFETVARLCRESGWEPSRRSAGQVPDNTQAVWLGDSMGELLMLYGVADVAFVGGSLVPTGGHNPLEPAAHGVPVVTGPQVFNFSEVFAALSDAGGVCNVKGADELGQIILQLLSAGEEREALAGAALQVLESNRGAVARVLKWAEDMAPTPP